MIASIDAIYENTGRSVACNLTLGKNYSKDLCSWLGDLQTFAADINKSEAQINGLKNYTINEGHIDFNNYVNNISSSFSSGDLLADIDAMNIVKLFIEGTNNSLSEAMNAYYTVMQNDNAIRGNRYYAFIYTSTIDLNGGNGYKTLKDRFLNEVAHPMNLECLNGIYYDNKFYNSDSYALELLVSNGYPSFAIRKYCAKLFSDYIVLNSHRFD